MRTIEMEDFSYEVKEQINFQEDKTVVGVEYWLLVEEEDLESVYEDLYKEAKEYMPAPAEHYNDGDLENILTGEGVLWEDEKGNAVSFSVTDIDGEENRKGILINLTCGVATEESSAPEN